MRNVKNSDIKNADTDLILATKNSRVGWPTMIKRYYRITLSFCGFKIEVEHNHDTQS